MDAVSMLGQRLQRWPNIETVFIRIWHRKEWWHEMLSEHCTNVAPQLSDSAQTHIRFIGRANTFIENETCVLTWNIGKGLDPN